MKLQYIATKADENKTIKQILKEQFRLSDRLLLRLKKQQQIFQNNRPIYVSAIAKEEDIIMIDLDFEEQNSNVVPCNIPLSILWEDESFLILDKPAGIAIHPSISHFDTSLSNGVRCYFDKINLHRKIRPINRLDKDTSGIVLFAKNEYVQECLVRQMKENLFYKEYIAICEGDFKTYRGTISYPIRRKEDSIIERCVASDGDIAITDYTVLETNSSYSFLKLILRTGRTHQIRVHLSYLKHPIIGDTLYGNISPFIERQALHAHCIQFCHPITHRTITITSPVPKDMKLALQRTNLKE